jgi:hypothetical protein
MVSMPPTLADDDDEDDLHPIDRDALERAIEMTRAIGGPDAVQIENMLARDPWEQVARFAAYCRQCDNLHLGPHQSPPCWVDDMEGTLAKGDDGIDGSYAAARLLQRMLDANISIYEPDPIAALERTKRTKRTKGIDDPKQPSPKL